jgi:hypothetical protein
MRCSKVAGQDSGKGFGADRRGARLRFVLLLFAPNRAAEQIIGHRFAPPIGRLDRPTRSFQVMPSIYYFAIASKVCRNARR